MIDTSTNQGGKIKPIIFWEGFPVCGLLLKKVVDEYKDDLVITATKPEVPFSGLEEILGHKIIWLSDSNDIWKRRDEFADRNFIIHTGWAHKGWLKYGRYMKKYHDAKIIGAIDNRYRGDFRQYVGSVWFYLFLKNYFDAVFVPGKEGQKLMKFFHMPSSKIYTGLYGAYEGIFKETNNIQNRKNEFLFVGQLNKRKSVDILVDAFRKYRKDGGTWDLRIVGSGPLIEKCNGEGIVLEPFAQPEQVMQKMNQAKVFILASRDDNWGTVLCEAAVCGMLLIGTKTVGASSDIIKNGVNGIILNELNITEVQKAFSYFENLKQDALNYGSQVSKEIAAGYDSNAYLKAYTKIKNSLFP